MKLIQTFRIAGGTFSIACLLLAVQFVPPDLSAAERQKIKVYFSIEGDKFNGLPVSERERIETEVAEKFSTAAERQWGFIDWSPGPPSSTDAFEWEITLKLHTRDVTSDGGGVSTGYIVTLEHAGKLAGKEFSITQTEGNKTVYSLGSIVEFQEAEALGEDILLQLDRQLGILLKSDDTKAFLQNIPIVDEVIAEETRIVVPVSIRDLRSKEDSVLDVKFVANNSQTGHLTMQTAAEVKDGGQYDGYVIGFVTALKVFPLIIATPLWQPTKELSEVINSASDVKVYMVTYSPSLAGNTATDGDVVLEPDL